MTIEFYTPPTDVKKWVLDQIRERLTEFHNQYKELTRAQVNFRNEPDGDKLCEISLTIYGDSFFVHRQAASFEQAATKVLAELAEKIDEKIKSHNEPPDIVTSTVKV